MWSQFCSARTLTPFSKGGDFSSKLSVVDLELIEKMKTMRGSLSGSQKIAGCARWHGRRARHFCFSFIRDNKIQVTFWKEIFEKENNSCWKRTIYLWKNGLHTAFYQYLSSKDSTKVNFFDEAGITTHIWLWYSPWWGGWIGICKSADPCLFFAKSVDPTISLFNSETIATSGNRVVKPKE